MPFFPYSQPASYSKKRNLAFGDVIGRGGYSEVRKATWNGQDALRSSQNYGSLVVAVKVVQKSVVHDKDNYIKILNTQLRMQHATMLILYDWFESSSKYYVIIELLDGEMFDYLVDQPYTELEAIQVVRNVLSLLVYCHDQIGIIHRDIKPENFLFRKKNHMDVVLTDFGIAKVLDSPHENERLDVICGTPGYAAPEIYTRNGYNRKCDLFSLGVFTFALLSSWSPWNAIGETAKDFISSLTVADADQRPLAREAIKHPWLTSMPKKAASALSKSHNLGESPRMSGESLRRCPTLRPEMQEHPVIRQLTKEGAPTR